MRLFFLSVALIARPVAWSFALGVVLIVLGEALRLWSAGILRKQESLAVVGPYARTRNPLYLGTLLALLGGCALSGRWWLPLVALPLFALFYVPTVRAEEAFLQAKFGEAYEAYCRAVPRWGWRWRRASLDGEGGFDWAQIRRNREWETAALMVLLICWVGIRWWW